MIRHLVLPAIAPVAVVGLYLTPVSALGCATRGLLALAVVFVSTVGAFIAIGLSLRAQRRSDPSSVWWIVSAAILTAPLALVLGPLG